MTTPVVTLFYMYRYLSLGMFLTRLFKVSVCFVRIYNYHVKRFMLHLTSIHILTVVSYLYDTIFIHWQHHVDKTF